MGVGRRIVRFTVKKGQGFPLEKSGKHIVYEMPIEFTLSLLMRIINWLTLFPPKREPLIAEIKFRYDDETRWLYRGIWKDTGTIETIVDDVSIKSLVVATYYDDKWFPIKEINGEPLPNIFAIEVQLRSQRDGKLLGKTLREEIVCEDGILTNLDIIIK